MSIDKSIVVNKPLLDENVLAQVKANIPENTATFPATEQGDPYQFISRIKQYCNTRYKSDSLYHTGHCAFVFIPIDKTRILNDKGKLIRRLNVNPSFDLKGKLFIVFDTSLSRSNIIDVTSVDEHDTYNKLCNEIEQLEALCGQALCHVLVDFQTNTATSFPEGAAVDPDGSVFSFSKNEPEKFTREKLEEFAENLHVKETKYPLSRTKIWSSQKNYQLIEDAEDRIVLRFAGELEDKLGSANIIYESTKRNGRNDLVIHDAAMAENHGPCVLEFKVIREADSIKRQRDWLLKGVLQARDYSKTWSTKSQYLMAYDGRKNCLMIPHVQGLADKYDVIYKTYRMYNSASTERNDELSELVKTIDGS